MDAIALAVWSFWLVVSDGLVCGAPRLGEVVAGSDNPVMPYTCVRARRAGRRAEVISGWTTPPTDGR